MSRFRTVLIPEKQSLLPGLGCSIFIHGGVLFMGAVFTLITTHCGPSRPPLDLDKTMEVSMVVLPKSERSVPDRASRAPVPRGTAAKTPDQPPPANVSDLTFEKEDAEEEAGVDDSTREQLMAELKRQQLLEDLMAPTGPQDRNATDPNSDSNLAINAAGAGARGDPEFAAYIAKVQRIFMENFKPLGAITADNPDLVCTVFITVDPASGRVLSYEVSKSSGIPAYDAAAERAVAEVQTIPLPPEKYLALAGEGYAVNFRPP